MMTKLSIFRKNCVVKFYFSKQILYSNLAIDFSRDFSLNLQLNTKNFSNKIQSNFKPKKILKFPTKVIKT